MSDKKRLEEIDWDVCDLCAWNVALLPNPIECNHMKNGYCRLFRLQAVEDLKTVHEEVKSFKK